MDDDHGGGVSHGSVPHIDPFDQAGSGTFPLPPLDTDFFSGQIPLSGSLDGDLDLDAAAADFDFDFSFDDLYLPSDAEDFLLDPSDQGLNESREESRVLNFESQESDSSDLGRGSSQQRGDHGCDVSGPSISDQFSGDRSWDVSRVLNSQSPGPDCCDREFSGPASSQGSGNCGSGVSETHNSLSQNSDGCCPAGSGSVPSSPELEAKSSYIVGKKKVKSEEAEKSFKTKRKKEHEEENVDFRTSKFRRSAAVENPNPKQGFDATNEEDEKKKARLVRNRESAQLSRQRKKHYVEELEDKVRAMHSTIQDLNGKISFVVAENAALKQQLGGGGMCPAPPPGMYPHPPMAHMAYPWVPCAPYVVKPQGSQVPLVPIPRLKPQPTVSTAKTKKTDSRKHENKTKKVASVSFLGLLFFVLLFGGLVPLVNVKYGGENKNSLYGSDYISNRFDAPFKGRVLTVNDHINGSKQANGVELCNGKSGYKKDFSSRIKCERGAELGIEHRERASQPGTEGFDHVGNASKPLVASLYVPRNDKLVKIDGNLIIHSVLASEKAMASHASSNVKDRRETGLAIAGKVSSSFSFSGGRHPYVYGNPAEQKKALTSGSADNSRDGAKPSAADGKLQQWFREGLAGPMLSSGMCTEVFQFDVSPASAPGGMIPASSVTNMTAEHRRNSTTYPKKGRNRRVLHGLPVPLPGSNLNVTKEPADMNRQNESFEGNKTMIVSVLFDPRETGDRDSEGIMRPKSLSRIFVVVLLDSVKYVTYSCVLPLIGSGPHLVTN